MVEKLLALIKANGWSISEFERRMGISTGTVNGWKVRGAVPTKQISKAATVLGKSEAYLRGETDDPSATQPSPKEGWDDIEVLAANSGVPINELSDEQKEELMDFARYLLSKTKEPTKKT